MSLFRIHLQIGGSMLILSSLIYYDFGISTGIISFISKISQMNIPHNGHYVVMGVFGDEAFHDR